MLAILNKPKVKGELWPECWCSCSRSADCKHSCKLLEGNGALWFLWRPSLIQGQVLNLHQASPGKKRGDCRQTYWALLSIQNRFTKESLNPEAGGGEENVTCTPKKIRQDAKVLKGHNVRSDSKTKMLPYVVAYLEPL